MFGSVPEILYCNLIYVSRWHLAARTTASLIARMAITIEFTSFSSTMKANTSSTSPTRADLRQSPKTTLLHSAQTPTLCNIKNI